MANSLPFVVLAAFTNNVAHGNPAAVVFLKEDLSKDVLKTIAGNLNQPITAFISQRIDDNVIDMDSATFDIRYFIGPDPQLEAPLCGHGTLAAAHAIFADGKLAREGVEVLKFQTMTRGVVIARKAEGGVVEMELPQGTVDDIAEEEQEKLKTVLMKAMKVDKSAIKYMEKGIDFFKDYLMVEVDEKVDVGALKMDFTELRETNYIVNIITSSSRTGDALFISRMFAPVAGVDEDQVCGTAHCLLTPYWTRKHGLVGAQVKARQVSSRGGELGVLWDAEKDIVKLSGEAIVISEGNIYT